ncbi:MAG: protein-L-isoaspartate(D-aspartate) O-methyltransferase [Planctomycetota bacterium JB042]
MTGDRSESTRRRELEELLARIERDFAETAARTGVRRLAADVRAALLRVPRHAFVDDATTEEAYRDAPLPIGHGQTISQPFIVALMTQLAEVGPGSRVLEVGTGSGYQAAVLSALGADVRSIERIPELSSCAAAALARTGHDDVRLAVGDGAVGWPAEAPYDAILVTAAALETPPALIDQLAPGGRLLIPIGPPGTTQQLVRIRKDAAGAIDSREELEVAFVPLVRD